MPGRRAHRNRRHSENRHNRQSPTRPATSPSELIREDFQRMLYTMRLRTTDTVMELILMQSVEGHAQMGHGSFARRRFPNTEMEDIVEALRRSHRATAAQRQDLIDEIAAWADAAIAGTAPKTLVNEAGEGLVGVGLLRHLEVEPKEVLRGLYLGGLRDDSDLRHEVEKRTGARIGGGRCYFVDTEVMHRLGEDGEKLARTAHGNEIEAFKREGLIVDDPGPEGRNDRIRYMYLRERLGGGASDDAAIIAGGKLYNLSVALGVFLADAVDTLEKYVLDYSDQDNDLARHLEQSCPELGLTVEDVYRLIWICSAPPEEQSHVPDSSLRHLLEIERDTDQCALESHLAYLAGHPFSRQLLASEEVPNHEFYAWCEARVRNCPL